MGAPLNLQRLALYVELADDLHFGRTAARIYISQSALSHHILALESELGVSLFVRDPGAIRLSEAGAELLPHARQLLGAARALQARATNGARAVAGRLMIGYCDYVAATWMPTLARQIRRDSPSLAIAFRSYPRSTQALGGLTSGACDVAILARSRRAIPGVRYLPLAMEELVAVLPECHELASREAVTMYDLAGYPFSTFTREGNPEGYASFMSFFDSAGRRPEVFENVDRMQDSLAWVAAGLGVTMLPGSTMASECPPGVTYRPLTDPAPRQETVLAWLETNRNAEALVLAQAAANRIREAPEGV